jgi:hypothetical protein
MQKIPLSSVQGWFVLGAVRIPSAVGSPCPRCGEKVIFSLEDRFDDTPRLTIAFKGRCPACREFASFWAIRGEKNPVGDYRNPEAIFMYPELQNYYPVPELSADVPAPLQRSLISTIDAFNSKNYVATTVGGRRTLEGIFKYLLPEDKRKASLAKLIELAKSEIDLAAPLSSLSHAIRDGGNLGAHFDMENEPSEALARQMVELLNYLVSYLYVLPKEIEKLEKSLEREPTASVVRTGES